MDYIGKKFGKLTILRDGDKFVQPSGQWQRGVICSCECGNEKNIRLIHITSGRTSSCNCEAHGDCGKKIYNTWRGIIGRCKSTHNESHLYHERGITVFEDWKSYLKFKEWAIKNGYKEGLTIDRKDNDKGYYPSNCRFVTQRENCNNRRCTWYITYKGKKRSLSLLLEEKGLDGNRGAIYGRVRRGWSGDKSIDTPIRKGNYKRKAQEFKDKTANLWS